MYLILEAWFFFFIYFYFLRCASVGGSCWCSQRTNIITFPHSMNVSEFNRPSDQKLVAATLCSFSQDFKWTKLSQIREPIFLCNCCLSLSLTVPFWGTCKKPIRNPVMVYMSKTSAFSSQDLAQETRLLLSPSPITNTRFHISKRLQGKLVDINVPLGWSLITSPDLSSCHHQVEVMISSLLWSIPAKLKLYASMLTLALSNTIYYF